MLMDLQIRRLWNRSIPPRRLSIHIQKHFLYRLSHLLSKGYPLLEALEVIAWEHDFKNTAAIISEGLKSGKTIDLAFQDAHFSINIVAYLYFARMNSDLETILLECHHMLELESDYMTKLSKVLRYPLILTVFLTIMVVVVDRTIFPAFLEMFQTTIGSNASVGIAVFIVDILVTVCTVFPVFLVSLWVLWKVYHPRLSTEKKIHLYEKMPLIRSIQSIKVTYTFSVHFQSIFNTGASLKECVQLLRENDKYPILSYYASLILSDLENGYTMAQSINKCALLKDELTTIFHRNADAKTLTRDLSVYANLLLDTVKSKLDRTIEIIQPLFFLFVAIFILLLYGSIMMPMYQWMEQL
ncbi:competence type IV pilus assembly protein ComGB [Thalassobacillus hwangdonensis]|uniref:Competence type IV pilus assembly protein ComGB n=1 Tax=Thalassobacillus hwangdonensis TaxID=546108 RepID=A0ABW3KYT9_9BACI